MNALQCLCGAGADHSEYLVPNAYHDTPAWPHSVPGYHLSLSNLLSSTRQSRPVSLGGRFHGESVLSPPGQSQVLIYLLFLLIGFPEQSVWGLLFVMHPCSVCLVSFVTDA